MTAVLLKTRRIFVNPSGVVICADYKTDMLLTDYLGISEENDVSIPAAFVFPMAMAMAMCQQFR